MTRPRKARVGHLTFSITWVKEADWAGLKDRIGSEVEDAGGLTNGVTEDIFVRLNDNITENNLKEVLLHELMHACYYVSMKNYDNLFKEEDAEEALIRYISPHLLSVLRDNAPVRRYLFE
jgi:hypothetical protein